MKAIDTSGLIYDRVDTDTYETSDLNRVGAICQTIVSAAIDEVTVLEDMRQQYGVAKNEHTYPNYIAPSVIAKTDFDILDTYTVEEMTQYLQNVVNVVESFPPSEYKELPKNMRFLVSESANNIEEDLKRSAENLVERANATENNIKNTADAFVFSGETHAGGII